MGNPLEDRVVDRLEDFNRSLRNGDDVCEKYTTRKVQLKVEPTVYNGDLVRSVRESLSLSQGVFAQFLGVAVKTVQSWEQDNSTPKPMACRFLDEIRQDPEHWRNRFIDLMVVK